MTDTLSAYFNGEFPTTVETLQGTESTGWQSEPANIVGSIPTPSWQGGTIPAYMPGANFSSNPGVNELSTWAVGGSGVSDPTDVLGTSINPTVPSGVEQPAVDGQATAGTPYGYETVTPGTTSNHETIVKWGLIGLLLVGIVAIGFKYDKHRVGGPVPKPRKAK